MATEELTRHAYDLLARLARSPRFVGSEAEARARRICREHLEQSGFACTEHEFEFSEWPGRWGPPAAALVQLILILVVARTARGGSPENALAFGAALFGVLAILSRHARRRWTTIFPLLRSQAVNLEASRGDPDVWLVAHIDTKSQTVPMLYRIASAVLLSALVLATLMAAALQIAGVEEVRSYWLVISLAAAMAALPSLLCGVRDDSPGAVDNASGVAAVLLAARQVPREMPLGVLITSGEELGLAGARAWADSARANSKALNCDTVDDTGIWLCMHTGGKPALSSLAETTAARMGLKMRARRLIPGILADSIAFSDRGLEAVTISRGSLATLARIHTRRDNTSALTGSGIADASVLLARLTREHH